MNESSRLILTLGVALSLCSCGGGTEGGSVEEETVIPAEVEERLSSVLGCYEELGYSPLPLPSGTYSLDGDDPFGILASGVTLEEWSSALLDAGFAATDSGSYLDPLGYYLVTLSEDGDQTGLSISFNDEAGEFPTHFLATMFASFDLPLYLNSDTFEYAENVKGEDLSKKFLLHMGSAYLSLTASEAATKTVTWTPKSDSDDPVSDVSTWLYSSGLSLLSSSLDNVYIDGFGSALVTVGTVSTETPDLINGGAEAGDVYVRVYRLWTSEVDEAAFAASYKETTGYDYDASAFPDFESIGEAKSMLLTFAYSSYLGPGYIIQKASKAKFQAVLDEFSSRGWSFSQSDGSYYHSYNFYGPKNEYRVYLSYYDHTKVKGLLSDIAQVRVFQFPSLYERLSSWMANQNVGGGTLEDIPELPASGVKGGSTSSTGTSFTLSGSKMDADGYSRLVAALEDDGWAEQEGGTDAERVFVSADGFYTFDTSYDSATGDFESTVSYDLYHYSGQHSYAELMGYAGLRLSDTSFEVPGLEAYVDVDPLPSTTVYSFYNNGEQRFVMAIPLESETAATAASAAVQAAWEAAEGWENAGSSSSGTVFYQNSAGVYLYATTTSSTSDGSTTYSLVVGAYVETA
jgi:predicted cobalt transporter CbtA